MLYLKYIIATSVDALNFQVPYLLYLQAIIIYVRNYFSEICVHTMIICSKSM